MVSHCGISSKKMALFYIFLIPTDIEHFYGHIGHLYSFFEEIYLQGLLPFSSGLFVYCCWVFSVLYKFWILIPHWISKYVLLFIKLPFCFLHSILWWVNVLLFFLNLNNLIFYLMFSSKGFVVLGLKFRFLIN